jgi:hypothetical protein
MGKIKYNSSDKLQPEIEALRVYLEKESDIELAIFSDQWRRVVIRQIVM